MHGSEEGHNSTLTQVLKSLPSVKPSSTTTTRDTLFLSVNSALYFLHAISTRQQSLRQSVKSPLSSDSLSNLLRLPTVFKAALLTSLSKPKEGLKDSSLNLALSKASSEITRCQQKGPFRVFVVAVIKDDRYSIGANCYGHGVGRSCGAVVRIAFTGITS